MSKVREFLDKVFKRKEVVVDTTLLSDIRQLIILRCQQGQKKEVAFELNKYGVDRATDLDEKYYPSFLYYLMYNRSDIVPDANSLYYLERKAQNMGLEDQLISYEYYNLSNHDKWVYYFRIKKLLDDEIGITSNQKLYL